jgi:hypothetical protein
MKSSTIKNRRSTRERGQDLLISADRDEVYSVTMTCQQYFFFARISLLVDRILFKHARNPDEPASRQNIMRRRKSNVGSTPRVIGGANALQYTNTSAATRARL